MLSRSASGLLDRLLRGRVWVACIGVLLVGIVFLNVSLLGLNSGIAVTADQAAEVRRENAELRLEVARLGASERIQHVAESRGFVMPGPGDVRYLDADAEGDGPAAARVLAKIAARVPAVADETPPPVDSAPTAQVPPAPAPTPVSAAPEAPAPAAVASEPG